MPTDNRLKYIDSQIADLGSQDLVDSVTNPVADEEGFRVDGNRQQGTRVEGFEGFEGFEGGVHITRARAIFLIFAAIIMILYVLDE